MRILITGADGFLGRHVAVRAAAAGHELVLHDRAFRDDYPVAAARRTGDIAEVAPVLHETRPEIVLHLAALLTDAGTRDPVEITRVNCLGTAMIFEGAAACGARRVVYASSGAASSPSGAPANVYGATKRYAEHLAALLQAARPSPQLVGLRFGWIYGPGRERGWGALQRMVEDFALERPEVTCPVLATPLDWTFVEDAAEAACSCLDVPLDRSLYDVAGDLRPVEDAIAWLAARFPMCRVVRKAAPMPPSRWELDPEPLKAATGFVASIRLEAGLARLIEATRAQRA
jgi:nucleoside-diphosphate-sugar epimerase